MLRFLVGTQIVKLVTQLTVNNLSVRSNQEAVVIDLRKNSETGNQPDVRSFRSLNRTDSTVVRNMNVTNLEARPLTVKTTRPQRTKSPLVCKHR